MKPKTKQANWPRIIIQWGVLAFILVLFFAPRAVGITTPDFEAYCPFGGLQALGSYLLSQALSCTMTSAQIVMGVILFGGVLLFSKLFCSYICPIGTVGEWLGKIGMRLKMRLTVKGFADKVLRSLKYILLFITLYFTLQSNELFCKKYDPYFALASGFNTDVVLLYAIIAISVVVIGSVFIGLFWCKYLCPLGALSNIFKFSIFFVTTLGIYLILIQLGVEISYVWPLAVVSMGGYIIELSGMKSRFTPAAKIMRNTETCTSCNLCSRKCHQGIDVAKLTTVKHVDCNLCGDCLLVCPVDKTLTINKQPRFNRLPVVALVALVILGITLGSVWEVPTIDLRWGTADQIENAAVFTQSGLKNVKCYGSSMAFANKMQQVEGIYGAATFVKHHKVKLYYDPDILTEEKIQEQMFKPQNKKIRTLTTEPDSIYGVTYHLDNFFDEMDFTYLQVLLYNQTKAVGLISEFDCPVTVKIFFEEPVKLDSLSPIVESKSMEAATTSGDIKTFKLGYKIAGKPELFKVSKDEYLRSFFIPFERNFNYWDTYSDEVLQVYKISLGKNPKNYNRLSYITSHLSNDDGVIGVNTRLDESFEIIMNITYVDSMTTVPRIEAALLSDSLQVSFSSGEQAKVANMFDFSSEIEKTEKNDSSI